MKAIITAVAAAVVSIGVQAQASTGGSVLTTIQFQPASAQAFDPTHFDQQIVSVGPYTAQSSLSSQLVAGDGATHLYSGSTQGRGGSSLGGAVLRASASLSISSADTDFFDNVGFATTTVRGSAGDAFTLTGAPVGTAVTIRIGLESMLAHTVLAGSDSSTWLVGTSSFTLVDLLPQLTIAQDPTATLDANVGTRAGADTLEGSYATLVVHVGDTLLLDSHESLNALAVLWPRDGLSAEASSWDEVRQSVQILTPGVSYEAVSGASYATTLPDIAPAVPEPASAVLILTGLGALGVARRRQAARARLAVLASSV
jgi:hypothetical protein